MFQSAFYLVPNDGYSSEVLYLLVLAYRLFNNSIYIILNIIFI